jgi:hypothetical protein
MLVLLQVIGPHIASSLVGQHTLIRPFSHIDNKLHLYGSNHQIYLNSRTLLYLLFYFYRYLCNRLCGLVVRVPGYRSIGPGFYSRRYQIF